MNWDAVTLQDCIEMHSMKGYASILNDRRIQCFVLESSAAVGAAAERIGHKKSHVSIIRAQRQQVK